MVNPKLPLGGWCNVWETDGVKMHQPVKFLCLEFFLPPGDTIMLAMKRSAFMYGWFNGKACWYTVSTPEAMQFLEDTLNAK